MEFKAPKNDAKYHWTQHVARKMMYYGLSVSRVLRVVRHPQRAEEGVIEGSVAVMQKAGTGKRPTEIWVMYIEKKSKIPGRAGKNQNDNQKLEIENWKLKIRDNSFSFPKKTIITAWRYPGVSPIRGVVPIPAEIIAELENENILTEERVNK